MAETWKECRDKIKEDICRVNATGGWKVLTNKALRQLLFFRVGSYLKSKHGWVVKILYMFFGRLNHHYEYVTGIQMPLGTKVEGGLFFAHQSCIIIYYSAKIGRNCTIFQGVTIGGMKAENGVNYAPNIGDNVVIFAGAKIIGDVKIGNNVVIGANAVVVKDVPDDCVVAGVPAKIISHKGREISKMYITE